MKKIFIFTFFSVLFILLYFIILLASQIELMKVTQTFEPKNSDNYQVGSWVDNRREITYKSCIASYRVVQQKEDNQIIPMIAEKNLHNIYMMLPLIGVAIIVIGVIRLRN